MKMITMGRRGPDAWARAGTVAILLAAVSVVRLAVEEPASLGVGYLYLLPTILAALWFGRLGGLAVGAVAAGLLLVMALAGSEPDPATLVAVRAVTFCAVGYLFGVLFEQQVDLRRQVAERERELRELRALREALVPPEVPERPELELATCYVPAERELAGDFFLVTEGPGDTTVVAIGDVVGKGLQAARRAAFVRAALATFAPFDGDPVRLLEMANRSLIEGAGRSELFVTAACLVFRPGDRTVTWALAGHPPPVLLDAGQMLDGLRPGLPLGIEERVEASPGRARLDPGAGLLLFTDGLVEARPFPTRRHGAGARNGASSTSRDQFGWDRLAACLAGLRGAEPADVVSELRRAAEDHAGGALSDDLCMVALRART